MNRRKVSCLRAVPALVLGLLGVQGALAVPTLHFFPGSAYNASTPTMDLALGTTGRTTDDFETATFIPGLSIVLSGGDIASPVTETSLPALFQGDTFYPGVTSNQFWDGTHTAGSATGNVP